MDDTLSDSSKCNKGINISFQNITYQVRNEFSWFRSPKTILNGVNGEFRCRELTAIVGPSGAGKSTLLDILTGYTTNITNGSISINGQPRDLKQFRRQTTYILQNNYLHMHITVWEAMFFSINLKIGDQLNDVEKQERIRQILEAIDLYDHRCTKTGKLSGGQRKRLVIAFELVDNPQFMAFDEPTSGLDSSTSTQVILLLKQLAQEGRTIVCSIHQPSAMLFALFDHLYAMADGQCIYAGATGMLVPFLAELDLICPTTYNPSDYLLEISTNDYGPNNDRLKTKIQNGLNKDYRLTDITSDHSLQLAERMSAGRKKLQTIASRPVGKQCGSTSKDVMYQTSFCRQWYLLTARTILCFRRDRSLAIMRFVIHLVVALLGGILYFNIGNDASMILNNYRLIYGTLQFFLIASFTSMSINFPLELPIVAREYFNRWYSKKAYYCALIFTDLPFQFTCVLVYMIILYLMTGQPLELFRFGLFFFISLMTSLISQSLGMIIGAAFGSKFGMIVGPFVMAPLVLFSGFFIRAVDAPVALRWLFHTSYLKYALEGTMQALFGFNRPNLQCNEIYCHFQIPAKFMQLVNMQHCDLILIFSMFFIIYITLCVVAFFVVSLRLKHRWVLI